MRYPTWLDRSVSLCVAMAMLVATVALGVARPAPALADVSFKITGGGWGHGIGLSQYGAQGYALKGWPYADILRWFYGADRDGSSSGVRVSTLESLGKNKNPTVQVNLDKSDASRSSWTLRGWKSRLKVSNATTTTLLSADKYYAFTVSGGKVVVNGKSYASPVTVAAESGSPALVVVKDASGPALNSSYPSGYPYMRYRGQLKLTVTTSTLRLVNALPMEQYLYGVVPRESPASWNAEALKAQAVAARSYAWAQNPPSPTTGSTLSGILHCTTYSQVYGGHSRLIGGADTNISSHEDGRTNSAVDATYGQVMYHAPSSTVIVTYFSSGTGGHTANIEDVWLTSTPKPYYKGVDDADQTSPSYSWAPVTKTGSQIAAAIRDKDDNDGSLGYSAPSPATVTNVTFDRAPSAFARHATIAWSNGRSYTITGDTLRSALGLKSTKIYISRINFGARYEQSHTRIIYSSGWTTYRSSKLSGGSYRYASRSGKNCRVAFKGTGFRWYAPKYPSGGRADVYLDGVRKARVSLYRSSIAYNQPIWTATGVSADTTHTVLIKVLGTKDAASRGTNVGIDAFEVQAGTLAAYPGR